MPGSQWLIVLLNIAAMFFVILIGWVARRYRYLNDESTVAISRFVVDITFPAVVLTSMLRTIDPAKLGENLLYPLYGAAVILAGQLVGLFTVPFLRRKDQRATFVFLIAVANWVYLPLPIARALYGGDGERTVLLFNIGAQVVLWTVGVWTISHAKVDWRSLRNVLTNPGLLAAVVGILLASLFPVLRTLETANPATLNAAGAVGQIIITALAMVGSLTIPLSLVVTGAQLGGLDISDHRPSRTLAGVIVTRLLVAPAFTVALVWGLRLAGIHIAEVPRMVIYIIALMPVAISCSMFTDRFGGDTSLAARGIFYSTLFSIVTVPALFFLIQRLGL